MLNIFFSYLGYQAGVSFEAVHYNPDVWGNPYEFDPTRFSPDKADRRHPHAFLAFSSGPR